MSDKLYHYGTKRHSGRYPWGSGEDPEQRHKSFLGQVDDLASKGLSEKEIADGMGLSIQQLRAKKSIAKDEIRKSNVAQARTLKDKGYSNVAIGERMNANESTVRSWLNEALHERSQMTANTADMLKNSIDEKGYIDVGVGVERHMGISRTKLQTAIASLKDEGYLVTYVPVQQLGTGKNTTMMVLSKPKDATAREILKLKNQGVEDKDIAKQLKMTEDIVVSKVKEAYSDVYSNKHNIKMITDYSEDGGKSYSGFEKPRSIDSSRVHIKYGDEGGKDKDGVIELRRGVDELSLGNSKYAQVRVAVDGTHYLKGMAIYSDDMPPGADIIYNTNKASGTPKEKVFKPMKPDMNDPKAKQIKSLDIPDQEKESLLKKGVEDGSIKPDPDMPFGATVRQRHYVNANGKKQLSALNIVGSKEGSGEEGAWEGWSRTLSSQVLSKQPPTLAKKQLGLAYDAKKEEYDEIMKLTNPVVKQKLLKEFSDNCDSAAVHLKGAAMPRQMSHVLLPLPGIKETEIYAPNYENGEKVVLIRHPHGGIFEIPELTVNNRNPSGRSILGRVKDAVGINPKVAEQLSGADFDGDTALVIPQPARGGIKRSEPLKGLKDFDPKALYKLSDDEIASGKYKVMGTKGGGNTGQKMGDISNLITDMTIKGATNDELCRAVKHSMVVIDAEKHKLNYTQSYIDNGIAALKQKYQGGANRGASTLISKASSEERVDARKPRSVKNGGPIDPKTGKKMYEFTGETYTSRKTGTVMPVTETSTKMAEADDAYKLSSGTPIESVYADHANKLKALANQARKSYLSIEKFTYSPTAKEAYKAEVDSLNSKLNIALKNAPLERHAQLLANNIVKAKREDNPDMTPEEIKKISNQALAQARARMKAGKEPIDITDREWEAIQARAISANTLSAILDNAKPEVVKRLATPRETTSISATKIARAQQMLASGRTQAEVASALGISVSTLSKNLDLKERR